MFNAKTKNPNKIEWIKDNYNPNHIEWDTETFLDYTQIFVPQYPQGAFMMDLSFNRDHTDFILSSQTETDATAIFPFGASGVEMGYGISIWSVRNVNDILSAVRYFIYDFNYTLKKGGMSASLFDTHLLAAMKKDGSKIYNVSDSARLAEIILAESKKN